MTSVITAEMQSFFNEIVHDVVHVELDRVFFIRAKRTGIFEYTGKQTILHEKMLKGSRHGMWVESWKGRTDNKGVYFNDKRYGGQIGR